MAQPILPRELDELKPLKQWVCYQLVWNEKKGKYGKVPKNPTTGYLPFAIARRSTMQMLSTGL